MWTQFLIGALFILLGIAIHKLKWYFLISGYNTMSREKKANVDTEGLGRLMGLFLYLNGGVLILLGVLNALDLWSGMTPFLVVIGFSTAYLLVRAQKYDHNLFDEKGKLKKGAGKKLIVPAAIVMIIFLAVGGLMFYVSQPTEVAILGDGLQIQGLYGEIHSWDSIDAVELHDELPRIERRTNGAAVGSSLKGHFRTVELGDVKLFVNASRPPFIYLTAGGRMTILNGASEEETRQVFEAIERRIRQ
jgi:hypothetical protein